MHPNTVLFSVVLVIGMIVIGVLLASPPCIDNDTDTAGKTYAICLDKMGLAQTCKVTSEQVACRKRGWF